MNPKYLLIGIFLGLALYVLGRFLDVPAGEATEVNLPIVR